jgi:hypothetical protein
VKKPLILPKKRLSAHLSPGPVKAGLDRRFIDEVEHEKVFAGKRHA